MHRGAKGPANNYRSRTNSYQNNRSTSSGGTYRNDLRQNGPHRHAPPTGNSNRNGHRGSFIGRRYQNGGNDYYGAPFPPNYRGLTEMTIRIFRIRPSSTTIADLRTIFSAYGKVCAINIETRDHDETPTGAAFVTFRPPPESAFWDYDEIRYEGHSLKLEYMHPNSRKKFESLPAEYLEMGVYLQPGIYVSEWKSTSNVSFSLDFHLRQVSIQFGIHQYTMKMENKFENFEGGFYAELDASNVSAGILTINSKFPGKFWVLDEKTPAKDKFSWSLEEMWARKVNFRFQPAPPAIKNRPLQPTFPDGSDQLGRWVALRITFNLDKFAGGLQRFKAMLSTAAEFDLMMRPLGFKKPLEVRDAYSLNKYVERRMMDFDIMYMVESNITHNYLHDYNLDDEFFKILSDLPKNISIELLKNIAARKRREYQPTLYLKRHLQNIKSDTKKPPDFCVMMRKVVITPATMYPLLPTMETSNRVVRHFINHQERFLRVQFTDESSDHIGSSSDQNALYNRIFQTLCNGIQIGNRKYEFLAFSSSQLQERSCWFFASTPDLTADDIRLWMGDFSSNKVVAKYAARMGQCFSSTRAITRLPDNEIVRTDDVRRNGYIFSDGIGKISYVLMKRIADEMCLKVTPSAVQFRLGGYKGVLCVSKHFRDHEIEVRPSQFKFESPHCVLEVIRSSRFISAYLNRQAITLLSTLGVPDSVFIQMKDEQVYELDKMLQSNHMAMKVLLQNVDEHGTSRMMSDLVGARFLQNRDPFIVNLVSLFRIAALKALKDKAKIIVPKGAHLLGVLDETETLKEEEVYVCVSDQCNPVVRKVITGTCIVFRNPCFHPGDIRVVTAVECKKLDHLVDVLVFPALGFRDVPSQCSGGDLDGDGYTVIWDERLIPKIKNYPPMEYRAPEPIVVDEVTIDHIKKFFVNYILNDELSLIANAHLAKADMADNGAFHGNCMRLAQLHSEAVDFPKTGLPADFPDELRVSVVPDFMNNPTKKSYESKRVLGTLYRSIKVNDLNDFDPSVDIKYDERVFTRGYESYLEDARIHKRHYDECIRGLMNQYGIVSEYEAVSGFLVNAINKVGRKKLRKISKSLMDAVTGIRRDFRNMFEREFCEGTATVSPRAKGRLEAKAFAWYYVTYHPSELGDNLADHMLSFPWIVHDYLCDIAKRNSGRSKAIEEYYSIDGPTGRSTYKQQPSNGEGPCQSDFGRTQLPDFQNDGLGRVKRPLW